MIVAGLDTSLTHTGFAIVKDNGTVLSSGIIKSKPNGDKPIDELKRIRDIVNKIDNYLSLNFQNKIDLVVIEGLAFSIRKTTSLAQLTALNYFVRALLQDKKIPFCICAPTTLKKFITGSGKGEKDMMMMSVYKNYGFEASDNNENDAYALAVCGLAIMGKPIKKLLKPQEEVISLLKKQL